MGRLSLIFNVMENEEIKKTKNMRKINIIIPSIVLSLRHTRRRLKSINNLCDGLRYLHLDKYMHNILCILQVYMTYSVSIRISWKDFSLTQIWQLRGSAYFNRLDGTPSNISSIGERAICFWIRTTLLFADRINYYQSKLIAVA